MSPNGEAVVALGGFVLLAVAVGVLDEVLTRRADRRRVRWTDANRWE